MVVPYKPTDDLNALTDEELCDLMKLTRDARMLWSMMQPHGFTLALGPLGNAAGGIHGHRGSSPYSIVVPHGTAVRDKFMPVIAETTSASRSIIRSGR